MSETSATEPAADQLRPELERLARRVIGGPYRDAQGIWHIQTRLLALQDHIQRAISDLKAGRRSESQTQELDTLRSLRWHARRLGDAFAWLLLGLERQVIVPLSYNSPVPITRRGDDGHRAVELIAAHLAGEGWGFPVLHDMTDCLRIGDVTFIRPAEKEHRTVEIKTRVLQKDSAEPGSTVITYETTLISPTELPASFPESDGEQRQADPPAKRTPLSSGRVERQVQRLHTARAQQIAPPGSVFEIDGQMTITTEAAPTPEHSDALRRVARRARRLGYATEAVDGACLYLALYSASGLENDAVAHLLGNEPFDDIHLILDGDLKNNALTIYGVPDERGRGGSTCLPYFLLPLPKASILDLLGGRMMIFNLVNTGQLDRALRSHGFEVLNSPGQALVVETEITDSTGRRFQIELHNLQQHMNEMAFEFRSVDYLVAAAVAMRDCVPLGLDHAADAYQRGRSSQRPRPGHPQCPSRSPTPGRQPGSQRV